MTLNHKTLIFAQERLNVLESNLNSLRFESEKKVKREHNEMPKNKNNHDTDPIPIGAEGTTYPSMIFSVGSKYAKLGR